MANPILPNVLMKTLVDPIKLIIEPFKQAGAKFKQLPIRAGSQGSVLSSDTSDTHDNELTVTMQAGELACKQAQEVAKPLSTAKAEVSKRQAVVAKTKAEQVMAAEKVAAGADKMAREKAVAQARQVQSEGAK